MLSVVVFPPLFLNLSLYVILDIPEVPAFKKRAQVFGGGSLYNECFPFDLKSAIIECAQSFRQAHFCKSTGKRRALFWAKIRTKF